MDCAKGTALAGLYDDLTVDILARLPVKDVRRSKCVSKPWRDLIADPLNRKKLPQTLEGFFYGGTGGCQCRCYGQFTSLSGRGESALPVDPSFSFVTAKLPGVKRMDLLDSCNGLLLFGCSREDKFGYIVCNPATEELVTVRASSGSCQPPPFPPPQARADDDDVERYAHTYLMFDPTVSSHFHLVQFWDIRWIGEVDAVYSYSSETTTWSDRSSKWEQGERGLWGEATIKYTFGRALVNGLLHFFVYHVGKQGNLIFAVDGEGKICRSIRWHDRHVPAISTLISQSQGLLHCIIMNLRVQDLNLLFTQLSVWVLEDFDTQKWVLKRNVSCSQLFGSLGCSINNFNIVAIHPDHNSIILVQHWNKKLVSYDIRSKELCVLSTLGEGYRIITPYVPCFIESPVLATKD